MVSDELGQLAATLADWAADARGYTVFLFGSFVRGDNRAGSDVDVHLWLSGVADDSTVIWKMENERTGYSAINAKLPGPLQILEPDDPLCETIRAASVVHSDRNVRCVWLPPV